MDSCYTELQMFLFKINRPDPLQISVAVVLISSIICHRDVQASSILLDDKFEVRLGSLSDVCPQEGEGHQNVITKLLRFSS
jgi:hypothetical protein